MTMSKIGNKRAFTLVEIILVMVIISILAGVCVPSLRTSAHNAELKGFISKLYILLDYAKSRATLKNTITTVTIIEPDKSVALQENSETVNHIEFPGTITVQNKDSQILFYPDGTSRQFQLVVQSADQKFVIVSRGFDGKIKIEDYVPQS